MRRRQRLRRIFIPFSTEHSDIAEPPGAVDTEELDALRHALSKLRPMDRTLLALAQEGRSQANPRHAANGVNAGSRRRLMMKLSGEPG